MYSNYTNYNNYPYYQYSKNHDRIAGGFLGPFLLGGITGAVVAPAYYGGYNRPYYNNYYYPYPSSYYYYGGYY